MGHTNPVESTREFLRKRFPQLSEKELDEACTDVRLYVSFLMRLADSIASDPERYARFEESLTHNPTQKTKADPSTSKPKIDTDTEVVSPTKP